jgi:phosphatidylserine/phosphatidylglycerophosphate/cardiolipin synthase-like enzyme
MAQAFFGDIRSELVDRIDAAEKNIKIAVAWFTSRVLFQLILDKAAGETKIQLLLSDSETNFLPTTGLDFEALQRKGAQVKIITSGPDYHFMHHKFVVIDENTVITGSYNWSNNAHTNYENIIVLEDVGVAKVYSLQFDALANGLESLPLTDFKQRHLAVSPTRVNEVDLELLNLAQEFEREVKDAMAQASKEDRSIRMDIIDGMIKRYTAVGAAKKLSNDSEQSGFIKLVSINRAYLTFEYLTAKSRFEKLFDKTTIKNAKAKLRPYIDKQVDNL